MDKKGVKRKKVLIVGSTSVIGKVLKGLLENCGDLVISFSRQSGVDIANQNPLFNISYLRSKKARGFY